MAKRLREEEQPTKVVTEDRAAKRQVPGAGLGLPENFHYAPPPGWDPLPAGAVTAKHLLLPTGHPAGEPLRPANQAAAGDAVSPPNLAHSQQQQQQQQQQHSPQRSLHHVAVHQAAVEQQQHAAAAQARAAAAELRCQVDIDWRSPEQVVQLLHMLHLERLRRQGLDLPPEYKQFSQGDHQHQ